MGRLSCAPHEVRASEDASIVSVWREPGAFVSIRLIAAACTSAGFASRSGTIRRHQQRRSIECVQGGRPQRSGEVHRLSTWSTTSKSHGFPSCCSQAIWRTVEAMASPLLSRDRIERASHIRWHRSTLRQLDRRWLERAGWRTTLEFRENHIRSNGGRLLGTESMWVAEAEFEGRVIAATERSESRAWARLMSIASA
jgi:hypothetical protein